MKCQTENIYLYKVEDFKSSEQWSLIYLKNPSKIKKCLKINPRFFFLVLYTIPVLISEMNNILEEKNFSGILKNLTFWCFTKVKNYYLQNRECQKDFWNIKFDCVWFFKTKFDPKIFKCSLWLIIVINERNPANSNFMSLLI